MNSVLRSVGSALARYLNRPLADYRPLATSPLAALEAALQPGDVLLVEGDTRIATAVKYITQSTWSHAALCLGRGVVAGMDPRVTVLIEADLVEGIRIVPLETYARHHTRICRPHGLTTADVQVIARNALARLGHHYDLKNVVDLARYLLPTPPVPSRLRRRMLVLGSGQPTRAICSTFIAQLFQDVQYPILPTVERRPNGDCNTCYDEVHTIRHHSLYAPRDFDVSPYFGIVKPTLEAGFDHRKMHWESAAMEAAMAA